MKQRLPVQGAQGDLLRLVATGRAESRADLARIIRAIRDEVRTFELPQVKIPNGTVQLIAQRPLKCRVLRANRRSAGHSEQRDQRTDAPQEPDHGTAPGGGRIGGLFCAFSFR